MHFCGGDLFLPSNSKPAPQHPDSWPFCLHDPREPNTAPFPSLSCCSPWLVEVAQKVGDQKSTDKLNAGSCSLVSHNGHPCDPGLAYSPSTGTCEWPDTLIDHGCNPEGIAGFWKINGNYVFSVVTGFGPCPQDASDPRLTPAQIASWPQPK